MSSRRRSRKGDPEEETDKSDQGKDHVLPGAAVAGGNQEPEHEMTEDEAPDDGTVDSEDGSLVIADMQEGKDTDDTEKDSEHSEDEEQAQLIFNGTMTRRQSKQFQDAGANFAVFSVRPGSKSKNRTCEYCGVVKATPAALVRHIRKHTGERPFVCQLCGKAYKAKRSLHLHQNSHHKEMGKMLPPNPSSLPTQVPIPSPIVTQMSPTPAISEATKSLLRETLESSRKARDGHPGSQTAEVQPSTITSSRTSERLSTPNLVNLLTSDIAKKASQGEEAVSLLKGSNIVLKSTGDGSGHYMISPAGVKKELNDEAVEGHRADGEEEQAQDLSMTTVQKPDRKLKCDFCNKSFKHEISRINHMRTAHNINLLASGNQQQLDPHTLTEPKSSSSISILPHTKLEPASQKQEIPTDLSISSLLARKVRESPSSLHSQEPLKMELPTVPSGTADGMVLDESNTLPYHVTSRMVQDFNVEELNIKDTEKSVLAEDGGSRRVRMSVQRETVLATRLDCINNVTGRLATVFKCHLCSRVFSSMLRYSHHLPSHYDVEVQTYDCRYCEASFRSVTQIVKHLQCHREKFSGLNAAGTGLNTSALLLEEFNRKQKPDQHGDSSSNTPSAFSSLFHSDESVSSTPQLEPGERVNGGYSCFKCRKSFSREYLLQRHMRIHQNQNLFYCSECEIGFNGELDLVEHRRQMHGVKGAGQLQYPSLLKTLSTSVYDPKSGQGVTQIPVSDSNNNSSGSSSINIPGGVGTGLYPLVDMKAFDLKRGEAVEVRMASEVNDTELRRAMLEEYQYQMLMKAAEMSAAARDNEQMRQVLNTAAAAEDLKRRMKMKHLEKKRKEEEEARRKEDYEKRRKMEQEKLKQKLAQEGMGDVTVVLPDAPPPDDNTESARDSDRPTDLSAMAEPPSGIGFMARKTAAPSTSAASRIDHVLQTEYGTGASSNQETEMSTSITDKSVSLKRPPPASAEPAPGPPSKSRRKAHKPQRINHCLDETDNLEGEKAEDKNNNSKTSAANPVQLSMGEDLSQNLKGSGLSLDPSLLTASMLSQLNQLAALKNASSFLSSDVARKHFSALAAANLSSAIPPEVASKYPSKLVAGFDAAGNTVLFNPSTATATAINSSTVDSDNNSGAIDLSTDSKDHQAKSSGASSIYQAYLNKMAASSSSSSLSSTSSPPADNAIKQGSKKRKSSIPGFTRSISLDPAALDSDNSLSQELTSAADLSKTSLLTLQLPSSQNHLSSGNPSDISPTEADSLVGCPRVQWKPGQPLASDVPDNFLGVLRVGQFNGKGGKSSTSVASRSRTSSPSPVPSPTNSDASSSAEGRKVTTTSLSRTHSSARATSLSRTHSRLSVVNEPLDRNSLCKPKVLDDGRSVYSCVICHKNFLSLSDINRHMDFHEGEPTKYIRPYKCKYCDYYARTNSQLKVHKLRHEGVREFCCRVCNYKGVTQSDLNRHMKSQVHLLRSNHVCSQCGEGFVTPKTLRDHSVCCTGSVDKSFEAMSSNDNDDDVNDDDYAEEELLNMEEASQGSSGGVTGEVKVVAV